MKEAVDFRSIIAEAFSRTLHTKVCQKHSGGETELRCESKTERLPLRYWIVVSPEHQYGVQKALAMDMASALGLSKGGFIRVPGRGTGYLGVKGVAEGRATRNPEVEISIERRGTNFSTSMAFHVYVIVRFSDGSVRFGDKGKVLFVEKGATGGFVMFDSGNPADVSNIKDREGEGARMFAGIAEKLVGMKRGKNAFLDSLVDDVVSEVTGFSGREAVAGDASCDE